MKSSLSVPRRRHVGISSVLIAIPLVHGRTMRRSRRWSWRSSTRHRAGITAHYRCRADILGHATPCPGHTASVNETVQQEEGDKTAHTDAEANNEIFMVANPAAHRRALALAAVAFTTGVAGGTVQEVLG